jgi:prepilin-type N-terminal cleavage/methylation domain-containing protein
MKRRAFTLIELLVVIAIIAILAAILFPVFVKAKVAAKKTTTISNQKQIAMGIMMYLADHDDVWPRNDDCQAGSSLNNTLNSNPFNPTGAGCTFPFYYRMNHFAWQKWIMPYVKNIDIFATPLREREAVNWNTHGQIVYGLMLNTAITGSLDTYNRAPGFVRQYRNSWLGDSSTSVPAPGETMILLEAPLLQQSVLPGASFDAMGVAVAVTVYPLAIKEFWRYRLMDGSQTDCINRTAGTNPDLGKMPSGGITVGFTDGHAKFLAAGAFLGKTPSKSEYLGVSAASATAGWTFPFNMECTFSGSGSTSGNLGFVATPGPRPNTNIDYPLWGLVKS